MTTEIQRNRNTARDELGVKPNPDRGDIDIYGIDARYLERFRPKTKE